MTTITKEREEYLINRVKLERLERTGADFPFFTDLLAVLNDYAERLEPPGLAAPRVSVTREAVSSFVLRHCYADPNRAKNPRNPDSIKEVEENVAWLRSLGVSVESGEGGKP